MNDAFNRSNDLQGFRAGLAEEHSQYAAGLAAKTNSYIQNLTDTREKFFGEGGPLDKAKMALGAADEMIKGGLEGEGAVAGAYMAGKTALKGYRYMKGTHTLKGDLTAKGKGMEAELLASAINVNALALSSYPKKPTFAAEPV